MKRPIFPLLVFALTFSGCAKQPTVIPNLMATPASTASPSPTATPATPFDYDASIPFDTRTASETERDGVTVVDLNYAAHDPTFSPNLGGRTVAYLVKPQGEGPFAGILFLHRRIPAVANRSTFLDEAVAMAQHGVICLLLQGYYPYMTNPKNSIEDRSQIIGQVIELRRAADFLLSQPGIDPNRLGFVGQDFGALYGGVLAGVDQRFKTFVLIAGMPTFVFSDGYEFKPPEGYADMIGDLDPNHYVGNAAPASIFFQFGKNDRYISEEQAKLLYDPASEPKQVTWYEDTHDMVTDPTILQDRDAWLEEHLTLSPTQP